MADKRETTPRDRPGMYIGSTEDAALHMALDLVANAVDLHLAGRCTRVDVHVATDGFVSVADDGPGFARDGGAGVPPLHDLLTTWSDKPTVDGHAPHVHLGRGGVGLYVVNMLSERFEIATVRDGVEVRGAYARGECVEPLSSTTASARGTRIRFRPDQDVLPHAAVPRARLAARLQDLGFLLPRLQIHLALQPTEAACGLASRIAAQLACAVEDVAHVRDRYATDAGSIEVEVAMGWRRHIFKDTPAEITSFVNYERTRDHGTHVDGLLEGIASALSFTTNRDRLGLVAAVAVVLPNVQYGNPSKDRLASEAARAPARRATEHALRAWQDRHPASLAAVRARLAELAQLG